MSSRNYLTFQHSLDIYQRTISTNDAGQKTVSYSKAATIKGTFQSNASERRIDPYIENIDTYQFYISYIYNEYILYSNRIQNVRDRYGNVLVDFPLEITNIEKKMGFGGRLHHMLVTTKKVVEIE